MPSLLLPSATRLPTSVAPAPPRTHRGRPQVPDRGRRARPPLTVPHPPGLGPRLSPDPDGAGAPSGLVKDTDTLGPHPARRASAAQVSSSSRDTHRNVSGQWPWERNDQRRCNPRRLPSTTSFIAADPPDSGTARSRWEAGPWT